LRPKLTQLLDRLQSNCGVLSRKVNGGLRRNNLVPRGAQTIDNYRSAVAPVMDTVVLCNAKLMVARLIQGVTVAAMNLVRLRARRANAQLTSFPCVIAAVGAAGVLQDSWPVMLPWAVMNLHAVYGVLLLCMVLQTQRTGLADPIDAADRPALRRQLSRAVYLQLYLVFGMSQLMHIAALLWNRGTLGALHPATLPPPENLRDYLAYGVLALFAIHVLPLLPPQRLRRVFAS
jgi:hypothetical protein